MDKKISNVKYELIASVSENLKEVMVTYTLNGQSHRYFVFVPKNNKMKDSDYIKEAKKKFEAEAKAGKIKPKKIRGGHNRPWLIATTCVLGVATLALGGLVAYKYLFDKGGTGGDDPTVEKEITFEQAQTWLDDHYDYRDTSQVQSGDYSWDYAKSVDVTNLKEMGIPFLLTYLITTSDMNIIQQKMQDPEWLSKMRPETCDNFHFDRWTDAEGRSLIHMASHETGSRLKNTIENHSPDGKPSKCVVKGDYMYVTYTCVQEIQKLPLKFEVTDVYNNKSIAISSTYHFENEEIAIPARVLGVEVKGTINADVYQKFNLSKIDSATNWIGTHYNNQDSYRPISSIKFDWDFTDTTEEESKNEALNMINGVTNRTDITTLQGEWTRESELEYFNPDIIGGRSLDTWWSFPNYTLNHNQMMFDMKSDEMLTNFTDPFDPLLSDGTIYKYMATIDDTINNNCYLTNRKIAFDHAKELEDKPTEVTGVITLTINLADPA